MFAPAALQGVGDARTQRHLERIYSATPHADPLALWEKVVQQCESLGVHTATQRADFVALLKGCVEFLKQDNGGKPLREQYAADGRLLAVYLRLADHDADNAYTYFRDMERHGLCQDLAIFHIAKSNVYERNEDFAIAGTILKEAIKRGVQPVKDLKCAYSQYKRRVRSRERKRKEAAAAAAAAAATPTTRGTQNATTKCNDEVATAAARAPVATTVEPFVVFSDDADARPANGAAAQPQQAAPAAADATGPVVEPKKFSCADFWGTPEDEEDDSGPAASAPAAGAVAAERVPTAAAAVAKGTPAQPAVALQNADDSDMTMNAKDALHKIEAALWGEDDDDADSDDGGGPDSYRRGLGQREPQPLQPLQSQHPSRAPLAPPGHDENTVGERAQPLQPQRQQQQQQKKQQQQEEDDAVFAIFNESSQDLTGSAARRPPLWTRPANLQHNEPTWEESGKKQRPQTHHNNLGGAGDQAGTSRYRRDGHLQLDTPHMPSSLHLSAIAADTSTAEVPIFADESSVVDDTPHRQHQHQHQHHGHRRELVAQAEAEEEQEKKKGALAGTAGDFAIFTEEQDQNQDQAQRAPPQRSRETDESRRSPSPDTDGNDRGGARGANNRRQTASPSALKQFMLGLDETDQSDDDDDDDDDDHHHHHSNTQGDGGSYDNGEHRHRGATSNGADTILARAQRQRQPEQAQTHRRFHKASAGDGHSRSIGMESSENLLAAIFESREESQSSHESGELFGHQQQHRQHHYGGTEAGGDYHPHHHMFIRRTNTL